VILMVQLRRRRGFWRMLVTTAAAGVLASACAGGAGLPGPAAQHHSPVAGARPEPAPASPLATRPAATPGRVLERHEGRVVMTRSSDSGVGPCVNRRAQIINSSHAAVAIDIHADGGPESGRGT
jgi:N-acetylmuramoyl-L-alanine amidase